MRVLFVLNNQREMTAKQTTHHLVHRAAVSGHDVALVDVEALEAIEPGQVRGNLRFVTASQERKLVPRAWERLPLADFDRILVRTNPGRSARPEAHRHALSLLEIVEARGTVVANPTRVLRKLGNKLGLFELPAAIRPPTAVTRDPLTVKAFVEEHGRSVLKPVAGTQGEGVLFVDTDSPNLHAATRLLARDGPVVAQRWIPQGVDGDVRLIFVDGEPLRSGGRVAAVRRRPAKGELRSNVHLGGVPEAVPELTPELEHIAEHAGPALRALGCRVAGLDCIGDRVVEANVFSPGGLPDIERFQSVPFLDPVLEALLA